MVSNTIQFIYNNQICSIENPDPNKTVLDYVRNDLKKMELKKGVLRVVVALAQWFLEN